MAKENSCVPKIFINTGTAYTKVSEYKGRRKGTSSRGSRLLPTCYINKPAEEWFLYIQDNFKKNPKKFLDREFSIDWVIPIVKTYPNLKLLKDKDVKETLEYDIPYISSCKVYEHLNKAYEEKDENDEFVKLKNFLIECIQRSPIVYYTLCNVVVKEICLCYNDFFENNKDNSLNIFGEWSVKSVRGQSQKLGVLLPPSQPFSNKLIPFISIKMPDEIKFKPWSKDNIEGIKELFTMFRKGGKTSEAYWSPIRILIIQFFMIIDNIHDFGKPRGDYKPKEVCGAKDCIIKALIPWLVTKLEEINKMRKASLGGDFFPIVMNFKREDDYDYDVQMFGSGFEGNLVKTLRPWLIKNKWIDEEHNLRTNDPNGLAERLNTKGKFNKGILWTHDTISLETPFKRKLKPQNKRWLNVAIFDGYRLANPVKRESDSVVTDFEEMEKFSVPLTYEKNEFLIYSTPSSGSPFDTKSNYDLQRIWPKDMHRGGLNSQICKKKYKDKPKLVDCYKKRADFVTGKTNIKQTGFDVANHVAEIGKILKDLFKDRDKTNNFKFFMNLKSLGDFVQVLESKKRGIVLLTQDSLEFLVGVLVDAPVIKSGKFGKSMLCSVKVEQLIKGEEKLDEEEQKLRVRDYNEVEPSQDVNFCRNDKGLGDLGFKCDNEINQEGSNCSNDSKETCKSCADEKTCTEAACSWDEKESECQFPDDVMVVDSKEVAPRPKVFWKRNPETGRLYRPPEDTIIKEASSGGSGPIRRSRKKKRSKPYNFRGKPSNRYNLRGEPFRTAPPSNRYDLRGEPFRKAPGAYK